MTDNRITDLPPSYREVLRVFLNKHTRIVDDTVVVAAQAPTIDDWQWLLNNLERLDILAGLKQDDSGRSS